MSKNLINVKAKPSYKRLQKIIDAIDGLNLRVIKYNEGYNRTDGELSKIEAGLENDDVVVVVDENDDTYIDFYVKDFKKLNIKKEVNEILRNIDGYKLDKKIKDIYINLGNSILKEI